MRGNELFSRALALIYPEKCPFCGAILPYGAGVCAGCAKRLPRADCRVPLGALPNGEGLLCVAPFLYRDEVRAAVGRFKFHAHTEYALSFAAEMKKTLEQCAKGRTFDRITCVPMLPEREARRGYNQAELLARALGRRLGIPYEALLVQTRAKKEQHTLTQEERAANVRGVYAPKAPSRICGRRILLCDDIVTTGSTLRECGRVLCRAGAEEVFCAAFAAVD